MSSNHMTRVGTISNSIIMEHSQRIKTIVPQLLQVIIRLQEVGSISEGHILISETFKGL